MDAVPAATLLLPYFELDPSDPNGVTTLFSINNAVAEPTLAHVTLWTDWAEPTLVFDVYLTGYDVQTINLRDVFNGRLPQTAPANRDPDDNLSPQGVLSQDVAWEGCESLPYQPLLLPPFISDEMTLAHRGLESQAFGGCLGYPFGDGKVRGYVTIDAVAYCSFFSPADPEYFQGIATAQNVLWGSYFLVDPENNFAQQETLVHIEACEPILILPPAGGCGFGEDSSTFYGRYVENAADQREPLPSTFALSFLNGGAFDGGTRLTIWRDTLRPPGGGLACGTSLPSWFPLDAREIVAFDEQENPEELCGSCDNCSPPYDPECLNVATQSVGLDYASPVAGGFGTSWDYGWMFLNLSQPFPPQPAQAWVTTISSASGRFSVATDAVALDDLCSPNAGSQTLFQ
jgi:hypothetical protein